MRCDPTLLWTLVEQSQEPSQDADALFEHIERCRECQSTLRSIGGNESWWSDVQKWLGGDQRALAVAAPQEVAESTAMDLAFLQPPKHPEMLGRIGRYDIEGVVGRGGMGIVFRGFDSDLQRCVAIKTLSPRYGFDATARQRFAREAQAAASVVHENVIPIFNVQADHDPPFLVMPYIAGATLERFVIQHGRPDTITVLRIARQIASGLRAAHQQDLIHRDIKPGNVLVTENVHRVWITDFGLARAVDDATLTHTGVIAGTPQFMSPEQSRGQRLDARSDLFSFGALLYFLSTGRAPFEADSTLAVLHRVVACDPPPLADARPDLPPAFVALVNDMLRKQPSQRPRDADEVSKRISRAIAERNSGLTAQDMQRRQRARRSAGIAAATVLLISTALGGFHYYPRSHVAAAAAGPSAASRSAVAASPLRSRWWSETVRNIDRQLTDPQADAAVQRTAQQLTRLAQRSELFSVIGLDLRRDAAGGRQKEIAAIAEALQRQESAAAQAWATVAADPTERLADDLRRLRRLLGRLPAVPELVP